MSYGHRTVVSASFRGLAVAGILAGVGFGGPGGCAHGGRRGDPGPAVVRGSALAEPEGFYQAGTIVFGPQPDEALFLAMRDRGVGTVINLRSRQEMEDLHEETGLDEAAAIERAGMAYIHIPLGGEDGYAPGDIDAFAAAIESADGDILVHCRSGARARIMWQAYLVERRGYSLAEAAAVAKTIGERPSALERLLDREIRPRAGRPLGGR